MQYIRIASLAWSFRREIGIVATTMLVLIALPILVTVGMIAQADAAPGTTVDQGATFYTGPTSKDNTYAFGYCTFWAALRRMQIGKAIPNTWGDAHTWDDRAKTMDYTVDHTPSVGAIMETDAGELGHVAFVEKVNPDGTWEISEMNAPKWDVVSARKFKVSDALSYNFIH